MAAARNGGAAQWVNLAKVFGVAIAAVSLFFGGNLLGQYRDNATRIDLKEMRAELEAEMDKDSVAHSTRMDRIERGLEEFLKGLGATKELVTENQKQIAVLRALEWRRRKQDGDDGGGQ